MIDGFETESVERDDVATPRVFHICLFLCVLTMSAGPVRAQYVPPNDALGWDTVTATDAGWNEAEIPSLLSFLEQSDTRAFVALYDGRIAIEAYFGDFARDSTWVWYSAGKSLMAVLVGLAQDEGLLTISDRTSQYLGRWSLMSQEQEDEITIRHQLTMTSGLDESVSFGCTLRICLQYLADAGTRWIYHNAPYSLLRDVIEAAAGADINEFTATRLGQTIGFTGTWVASGYNNFFHSTALDAARLGLLVSRGGSWGDQVVLADTGYVEAMTNPSQPLNPSYGYLWWLNGQSSYIAPESPVSLPGPIAPSAPADAFVAAGAQGQFISVVPSRKLVWVRMGGIPGGSLVPIDYHDQIWEHLAPVVGADPTSLSEVPPPLRPPLRPISVYPNPAFDRVFVTGERGDVVAVYDVTGRRTAVAGRVEGSTASLDVSRLAPGMYVARREGRSGVDTALFVRGPNH